MKELECGISAIHVDILVISGHLSIEASESLLLKKTVTYINFSNDGNELLVNLGSEQVMFYLYT